MKAFNRKNLMLSGLLIVLVIALLLLIKSGLFTYSRYETHVTSQNSITTAVYLLDDTYQTLTVRLPDIQPSNNQYAYSFSISNYNEDLHCDTNLKYRIHIRTTTNADITYQLFSTLDVDHAEPDTVTRSTVQDQDGTHFNHIYTDYKTMLYSEDKTDYYTILFTFPTDFIEAKYSGLVELIEINVESSQIIASDT